MLKILARAEVDTVHAMVSFIRLQWRGHVVGRLTLEYRRGCSIAGLIRKMTEAGRSSAGQTMCGGT